MSDETRCQHGKLHDDGCLRCFGDVLGECVGLREQLSVAASRIAELEVRAAGGEKELRRIATEGQPIASDQPCPWCGNVKLRDFGPHASYCPAGLADRYLLLNVPFPLEPTDPTADLATARERISALEADNAALRAGLDGWDSIHGELNARIAGLERQVAELETRLGAVTSGRAGRGDEGAGGAEGA